MWNYNFAIPGILILAILLINYFLLQRLPLRLNRYFIALLTTETIVISADILSTWACENYQSLPRSFVIFANMFFFFFFLTRAYLFFVFTCNLINISPENNSLIIFLSRLPLIVSEIVLFTSPWTKAIFSIEETGYHRGTFYNVIPDTFFIYLLASLFLVIYQKHIFRSLREYIGILFYLSTLLIGLILRVLLPKYLLMDIFCIMAIITINNLFLNPYFFIDKRTLLFNGTGIRILLEEKNEQKHSAIFGFVIRHYMENREIYSDNQMDAGINLISSYLKKTFPHELLFYHRSGRFIIMAHSGSDIDEMINNIASRFELPWSADNTELFLDAAFVKIDSDYTKYDTDVIMNTLLTSLDSAGKSSDDNIIVIDDKKFEEYQYITSVKRSLENAIETHSVEIFLQPIVNAKTHKLAGAESLCRIRDESGNIISPGTFIPLAESNGRISALGEQVFENTCQFIRDYDMNALGIEWINVNLSAIQFMQLDLAKKLSDIVKKYNVNPKKIHLEITEAALIDEVIMRNQINELQKNGFMFSLDDYGTGFSNASRLKHIPFANVKIDMTLVWDHCAKPDSLLPMTVETFKKGGYSVTAEGIETNAMADEMTQIGCDYLQGMYFSAPIPISDFIAKYK